MVNLRVKLMSPRSLVVLPLLLFAGCANVRIVEQSQSFSASISHLQQQEVIDNIDETIDVPYRLARRTTFGKGALTFTDGGSLQVAVPFHVLAANAGTATGQAGAAIDSYQLSLVPEIDGPALSGLRQFYQAAVYPERFPDVARPLAALLHTQFRWLFWRRIDGSSAGNDPPPGAIAVGRGHTYEVFALDPEAYAKFVLLTLGTSPAADRAKDNTSAAAQSIAGQPPSPRKASAKSASVGGKSAQRKNAGLPYVPTANANLKAIENSDGPLGKILQELQRPREPQGTNSDVLPARGQ